jgi:hypothetical protein
MLVSSWLAGLAVCLLLGASDPPTGRLAPRTPGRSASHRPGGVGYAPREGDLIFFDDHNRTWTALFAFAGTGPPLHMGIVVKKPDGKPAVLEAGPDDSLWVALTDLGPRLHQFKRDFHGTLSIRRCKKKLTEKESRALTTFAREQKGKRYAALRLLLQGTPFRERGFLKPLLAKTHLKRDAWICSELAVAAAAVAGLLDPKAVPANAVYPRDLVNDERYDLSASWREAVEWRPGRSRTGR